MLLVLLACSTWIAEPVRVVPRVLYIENHPRWEFRAVCDYIVRDEWIEGRTFLVDADERYTHQATERLGPLPSLPRTAEDFRDYDVVILGDLGKAFYEAHAAELAQRLRELVQERGGGLVLLAGDHLRDIPPKIGALLPVSLKEPSRERDRGPDQDLPPLLMNLTAAGRGTPWLRLRDDAEADARQWSAGSRWYWCARGVAAAPSSRVLVEMRDNADGAPTPVIVEGSIGRGRTVYLGADEFWRWRSVSNGIEDHRHLWRQLLAHAAAGRMRK